MTQAVNSEYPVGERSRLRRRPARGAHDHASVHAVLDAAVICHLGFVVDGQPFVVPTAHWRDGEAVYVHGSAASRTIRAIGGGLPVCLTVSLLDGLVLARSGFHSSMNYRSAMVFGTAALVDDPAEKEAALRHFVEKLVPGRWADLRPPTAKEMAATGVLRIAVEEASTKIRTGGPSDDEEDYALPIWAGVVPVRTVYAAPEDDPKLRSGIPAPEYLRPLLAPADD